MTNYTICRFYKRGKISFLLVILTLLSFKSFAQPSTGKTPQEKQLIRKADGQWRKAHFTKALFLYQKAIALNPSNSYTNFQVGAIYFITDSIKVKSLPYFRNTIKYSLPVVDDTIIDAYYYMAYCYMLEEKYDSSSICFKKYKGHLDEVKGNKEAFVEMKRNLDVCKMAPDILKRAPDSTAYLISGKTQPTYITNVGTSVNSPFSEYSQLLYERDSVMVFTSRRPESQKGKIDELTGRYYEDTYISKKGINGSWSVPAPFTQELHIPPKKLNMATVAVSNDGNTLYIYKGGSILQSGRANGAWSAPQNLNKNIKNFKRYYIPSIFVSEDGSRLLLVSDKKGGQGGRDIYMCMKDASGNWSEPQNLGPVINTSEDEDAPYLMPDNKTLFFSSRGHGGLGGYDIFVSHYENGAWSQPQNLGAPINSPADDIYFSYKDDEKKGYFSSSRINGSGDMDIYYFAFTCDDIDNTSLKGRVLAGITNPKVIIQMTDLSSKVVYPAVPVKVDENGNYSVKLKPGHKYHMGITSEGYLPYNIDFSSPHQCNAFNLYQTIRLSSVDDTTSTHVGQNMLVKNAFYRSAISVGNKNARN
ncbi:MAG TPA: hypothetical protein VK808_06015, partial [Bacteroidia bacterium]|nr:hypothetical protein [Bacteroidia bacterium]